MRTHHLARASLLAAITAAWALPAARADFVLKTAPSRPIAMAPLVDPGDPGYAREATLPAKHRAHTTVHWKKAYGFGHDVPLAFACRQIVPPGVKVTYGPGANPDMRVSWKGGEAWNRVLRKAIKPLGLRLVMRHMAVEIRN